MSDRCRQSFALVRRLSMLCRAKLGEGVQLRGRIWVHGGGCVEIRDKARIEASEFPVELHSEPAGSIVIGEGAEIGGGTSIEATLRVTIGDGAKIGQYCKIIDNNFHEARGDRHRRSRSQPVEVGAQAVIGDRAILLPGARVMPGQVIRPGAILRGPAPKSQAAATQPEPSGTRSSIWSELWEKLRSPRELLTGGIAKVRAWLTFHRGERSRGVRVRGAVRIIRGGGTIRVGARATFRGGMIPTILKTQTDSRISIGEKCILNYGVTIDASAGVTLGPGCMIGSMVVLRDREGDRCAPITIEERVWLAHGVVVKPGVHIGSGSVVSAGSVVLRDIPANSLAAGNPARFVPLGM